MVRVVPLLFAALPIFLVNAGFSLQQGITEAQFNAVLDVIETVYTPIIEKHGLKFVIQRNWTDDTVNATPLSTGTFMAITVDGGLARSNGMTQDGLALVVCHELGHLLGGVPHGNGDMANEGQADYFATSKCLRRVFAEPAARLFSRLSGTDPTAQKACSRVFKEPLSRDICVRSAMAALSASTTTTGWSSVPEVVELNTPDPYRTSVTDNRHMPKQCRLDTQFQGALCAKSVNEEFSDTDPEPGACTLAQGYTEGLRPRCWYQPPKSEPPE